MTILLIGGGLILALVVFRIGVKHGYEKGLTEQHDAMIQDANALMIEAKEAQISGRIMMLQAIREVADEHRINEPKVTIH